MKVWLKILGATLVVLAAAAASIVALVMQYDYNQLKPTIAQLTKDATGRDLVINGDLELAVSLSPVLNITDIVFANAAWGTSDDMVRLDQLAAKLDLLALLQGRVDIDYIVLGGLEVVLETDGKGRANWEFTVPGAPIAPARTDDLVFAPNVRDVRLHDVDLTYRDGYTGNTFHLQLVQANFRADGFTAPMRASVIAAYQGVDVDAAVDLGSFEQLVSRGTEPFPVDMEISAPGVLATVSGTVDQPQAGLGVKTRVDVRVTETDTVSRLMGVELPNLDGLNARFSVDGGGTQFKISSLDARVGDSDVAGNAVIDLGGARPRMSGKVTSKVLDLDGLLDLRAPGGAAQSDSPPGPLFSRVPLPVEALRTVDADISAHVSRLKAMNLTIDAVEIGVKMNAGRLDVKPLALSVEDGAVNGTVSLNAAASMPAPTLDVTGQVRALDVGRVLNALGYGDLVILPLVGDIKLSSSGTSPHLLMANLNGDVRFVARSGRIKDAAFKGLTTGLGKILPWAKQADGSVITCMVADWPVARGIATAKTVLMDTPGFNVAVTGNIDLGGELLHLTVIPNAKTASLASFAVPVRLKGPLNDPYVDVDPGDLVVGTVGNIVKAPVSILSDILGGLGGGKDKTAQDPCLEALGEGKTAPAKSAPANGGGAIAPPPSQNGEQGTETTPQIPGAETLGKALEGLFGR